MLLSYTAGVLMAASLAAAQINTDINTVTATGTPVVISATATPCSAISVALSSYSAAFPSATIALPLYASVAYECALSAPLDKTDALAVVDGLTSVLEWQSTLAYLKDPPAGYPLAGVDLMGELADLRSQVDGGEITSEIVFQTNISTILARTYDGHVWYNMDAAGVFTYQRPFGPATWLSVDGKETPKLYLLYDIVAYNRGVGRFPSAITTIDGVDAIQFIEQATQNGSVTSFQDPDALFNNFMWSPNSGSAPQRQLEGLFMYPGYYPGETTTLTFANGTEVTDYNLAITAQSFDGVFDGPSFYYQFCNATQKALNASPSTRRSSKVAARQNTPAVTQLPEYPVPNYISVDGAVSGYFLTDPGYEDVAVLFLAFMSQTNTESAQATVTEFLNACRSQNMKHLVLDITGNPGGAVALGYDIFKQLFPDLEPYGSGHWRAHQALDDIGKVITEGAQDVMNKNPNNGTAYLAAGGASEFDGRFYNNDSGSPFNSWSEYYGPITAHGDNFTNLYRWNFDKDAEYQAVGILISGYGTPVAPQPFEAGNIVIVGDGKCSSTCTILSHLLKWQAKVKSIAVGGRPINGPMQSQGGVKGSQVMEPHNTIQNVRTFLAEIGSDAAKKLEGTEYEKFDTNVQNLLVRGTNFGTEEYLNSNDIAVNSRNSIREGDSSYIPLQFVYEAADCKIWPRTPYLGNVAWLWYDAATTAFGLNGTTAWAACVEGSTGDQSSLSGNSSLYNNGVGTNVTAFISQGTNGDGAQNSARQLRTPVSLVLSAAVAVFFAL